MSILSVFPVSAMITFPDCCKWVDAIAGRKNISKILYYISFIVVLYCIAEIDAVGGIGQQGYL